MSLAQQLADAFVRDFWAADREIVWTKAEEERSLWLDDQTLIVGKIDALGVNGAGEPFFGEWKTLSKAKARNMGFVKHTWKMTPQALTYAVLVPEVKKFTVRWAIKTDPITTDFEWFDIATVDIDHWKRQLLMISAKVRTMRKFSEPWQTNYKSCYAWGPNYPCPFQEACWAHRYAEVPPGMQPRTESHLNIENSLRSSLKSDTVILDATRVGTWFECEEKYRKLWEGEGLREESIALEIGKEFHEQIDKHIKSLITHDRSSTQETPTLLDKEQKGNTSASSSRKTQTIEQVMAKEKSQTLVQIC